MVLRCVRAGVGPRADFARKAPEAGQVKTQKFSVEAAHRLHTPAGVTSCALLLGASLIAVAASDAARAQDAQLPPLTVEASQKKKQAEVGRQEGSRPAAAPAPAPVVTPVPAKAAAVEPSDVPYTVPAGVSVVRTRSRRSVTPASTMRSFEAGDLYAQEPETPVSRSISAASKAPAASTRHRWRAAKLPLYRPRGAGLHLYRSLLLAGIEVQRGAVSTAGGAGALAGAANLRTLEVEDILKPGQTMGGLSTTWGTNEQRFTGLAAGAAQSAGVGIAGAVGRETPRTTRTATGSPCPLTFQDPYSGLFKANFRINEENSCASAASSTTTTSSPTPTIRTLSRTLTRPSTPISRSTTT